MVGWLVARRLSLDPIQICEWDGCFFPLPTSTRERLREREHFLDSQPAGPCRTNHEAEEGRYRYSTTPARPAMVYRDLELSTCN